MCVAMPHIIIECDEPHGLQGLPLAKALHNAAMAMEALPTGGIRTRLYCPDASLTGDGAEENGFCYVTVRLGKGRSESVRREIGERLFGVLQDWAEPALSDNLPISLGLEVEEIEGLTFKRNTIHDLLKAKAGDVT